MFHSAAKAERFLRATLMANAVFSVCSGAVLALGSAWAANLLGDIPQLAIQIVGAGVFIFGVSTGLLARRSPLPLKDAAIVSAKAWSRPTNALMDLAIASSTREPIMRSRSCSCFSSVSKCRCIIQTVL